MTPDDYIYGTRAVIEAIEAGKQIDKILISKDLHNELVSELIAKAHAMKVIVTRVPAERINRITRKNHQGVLAIVSAITYHRLDHLVPALYEEGILPFIVLLDGITDVRNFGAIARTCECAGVDAIVIPDRGSVSVGGDAIKTSAGALHHIPVCRCNSIAWAARFLRENGYNVAAVSEKATINYTQGDYTAPRGPRDGRRGYRYIRGCNEGVHHQGCHTHVRQHRLAQRLRGRRSHDLRGGASASGRQSRDNLTHMHKKARRVAGTIRRAVDRTGKSSLLRFPKVFTAKDLRRCRPGLRRVGPGLSGDFTPIVQGL